MAVTEPTVNVVRLVIPGAPVGKERPRVTSNGTFTPAKTKRAENDVRAIWREAGALRLPDGPLVVYLHVYLERPQSHFTSKGALSAVGRREPFPVRRPDADNVQKGIFDALNGLAYRDDAQIVEVHFRRLWIDHERETGSWTVLTILKKTLTTDVEPVEGADVPDPFGAFLSRFPVQDELKHQDWEA